MTPKDALQWCETFEDNVILADPQKEKMVLALQAMKECKKALKKQIPKKVKTKKYAPTRCNCGFEFSIHYGDGYYIIPFELKTPYCKNCGQAIDWSGKR